MFAVPVRFVDSGAIEVAIADPADADVDALAQILGRRVELVVGERSVIQDSWRYMR
jgi:Type II secretion system (T2SS), protein E, N-terminal domain